MTGTAPLVHRRAVGAALLVTLLWSSSWVLIRFGMRDHDLRPFGFAALRYGAAALVLMAMGVAPARRAQLRSLHRRDLALMIVLGVVFYGVTQGAQFVAIATQPAATTTLVLSMTPLVVGVGSLIMTGEAPTGRQMVGAGLIAVGAAAYSVGELGASRAGMTAALIALAANSAASLLGRVINREGSLGPYVVTTTSMTVGAASLIGAALAFEGSVILPDPGGWVIVVWLAVVNTAAAFMIWNWTLGRLQATESAALNNSMLIQIALLGWAFLDEPLGVAEALGILLVTAGMLLAQRRLSAAARRER